MCFLYIVGASENKFRLACHRVGPVAILREDSLLYKEVHLGGLPATRLRHNARLAPTPPANSKSTTPYRNCMLRRPTYKPSRNSRRTLRNILPPHVFSPGC